MSIGCIGVRRPIGIGKWLAAAGWYWGYGTITLEGNNAARSSASDAAIATLEGKNVTVSTN